MRLSDIKRANKTSARLYEETREVPDYDSLASKINKLAPKYRPRVIERIIDLAKKKDEQKVLEAALIARKYILRDKPSSQATTSVVQ